MTTTTTTAYDAALETARAASAVYAEAVAAYRARTIDDDTYLAARSTFKAAQDAFDAAYAAEQRRADPCERASESWIRCPDCQGAH